MDDAFVGIIKKKLYIIIFALFLSTSLIAGWSIAQFIIEKPYLEQTDEIMERVAEDDMELLRLINAIRFDVVQVQQHLSDVSATRGLEGHDDGFAKADTYAKDFAGHVAKAIDIARDVGWQDKVEALQVVSRDFSPYYEMGIKMARMYIAEGTLSGNRLMGEFDEKAEVLSGRIQSLLDLIGATSQNDLLEMEESVDMLIENNRVTILLSILPALLSIVAATFGVIAVRRICKVLAARED